MSTHTSCRATPARAPTPFVPPIDPVAFAEVREDFKRIERDVRLLERHIAWNRVIDKAIALCRLLAKVEEQEALKHWRDQPRVPRGNPDGGQWSDGGGGASAESDEGRIISDAQPDNDWKPGAQYAQAGGSPGKGHNSEGADLPPDPPEIPEKDPQSQGQYISLARAVANYMSFAEASVVLEGWALAKVWPMVQSSFDAPKSFAELQRSRLPSEAGYQDHHIAEQASAAADGFSRSQIDSAENIVRIPQFKHYEITKWYSTKNIDYGGQTPREYLKGKSWQERMQIGRQVLIDKGVLKP